MTDKTVTVTERVFRDGFLRATPGDELTAARAAELGIKADGTKDTSIPDAADVYALTDPKRAAAEPSAAEKKAAAKAEKDAAEAAAKAEEERVAAQKQAEEEAAAAELAAAEAARTAAAMPVETADQKPGETA